MVQDQGRGLGRCIENHTGSYGYPTRPAEQYPFCPQCGNPTVWQCAACGTPLPDDADELSVARFCRQCGAPYFDNMQTQQKASDVRVP